MTEEFPEMSVSPVWFVTNTEHFISVPSSEAIIFWICPDVVTLYPVYAGDLNLIFTLPE